MPHPFVRTLALMVVLAASSAHCLAAPFEDSMTQRMRACTTCHGDQGRAGPDGYYPRLAGKPAGYLYNQLINIREGRRHYPLMLGLLEPLDDNYLREMAQYFSALTVPYPAPRPTSLGADVLARGHALVTQGDASREIPPCQQCHGEALTGAQPHVPGLLGLPRDYLNAQLGGWRTGQRRAQSPDCMAHIASRLTPQDIVAVTGWLAAQPLPADTRPLATLPPLQTGAKELRCGSAMASTPPTTASTALSPLASRGAYLARVGGCASCHTTPGGAPYAGQRAITTPYGQVFSSNLTSDKATGLGQWRADDFWQALHHGRSRDGRWLNPAFPYTSYTRVTRADSDALFAYFQTVAPVHQLNLPHQLRWPFGSQAALAVWRALFFKPQVFEPQTGQTEPWNRGAYLVNGLGHCDACHTPRNLMGAPENDRAFAGGQVARPNWLAPSLVSTTQAGTDGSRLAATLRLLQSGVSAHGTASGPMAQVVQGSTQYLSPDDLQAVGVYLTSLTQPGNPATLSPAVPPLSSQDLTMGAALYNHHCADCHGANGRGVAGAYPALANNRAVLQADSGNLIQTVLHGGFAPVTATNPRPFGMPPYVLTLSDLDIARVLTYIRQAWGNQAAPVTEQQISRLRDQQTH
ncbi:c-type cytochrome [Rhodoferax sp.]|uniref:c-type cytochrome n=1 Tax=Rhodoferax sp. TaxID=50421 RepID=UPI0026116DB2|nr:c-type cytochrome [Rhodoferax sp.]MDD2925009.1 c-type cytochrome [Rhodoferax sp.]